MIKLITNYLMSVFIQYSVLRGYNFAMLSHSSIFELLRIINNILYNIKYHNKEI